MRRSGSLSWIWSLWALLLAPVLCAHAGEWRYADQVKTVAAVSGAVDDGASANSMTIRPAGVASGPAAGDSPGNNMLMNAVRSRFGVPDREATAVGEPPITRWYYAGYTVYFEVDRVITSVVN